MANLLTLDTGKLLALIGKLAKAGFTVEMAEAVLDGKHPRRAGILVEALHTALAVAANTGALARMLAGYDLVDPRVTEEDFPVNPELFRVDRGHKSFRFVGRSVTTTEVEEAMRKEGFVPFGIEMLLAYGATHPDEPHENNHPLVALGSSWKDSKGFRLVPFIGRGDGARHVQLANGARGAVWGENCQFLAVPKSGA